MARLRDFFFAASYLNDPYYRMNLLQVTFFSIITAAEYGILAIGLTLTFSILRFPNFAHLSTAVLGAYVAYVLNVGAGLNFFLAMGIATVAMGLVGIGIDKAVFSRMRQSTEVTLMIASLGVSLILRYGIQAIWGAAHVRYDLEIQPGIRVLGAYITEPQLHILAISGGTMALFHVLLKYTRIGKAMRATATNPTLAQASCIDTERIIRFVWFIGTAFAGLGGVLVAWDTQLDPYLGFNLVLPVFCVVLIGGIGSFYGAIMGALIVGFAQNFGVAIDFAPLINSVGFGEIVDSAQMPVAYKAAIPYIVVVLVLLWRPTGLARRELI